MSRINTKKVIIAILAAIGAFYVSLHFYNPILQILMKPISDAIASGLNVPISFTSSLGEAFRISFKIALYIASTVVILIVNKRIAIPFIFGNFIAYIFVLYGLFDIWNIETEFSMEDYINHLLGLFIVTGMIFSGLMYRGDKQ